MDKVFTSKCPCPVCKTGAEYIMRESSALPFMRGGTGEMVAVFYLKCPTCGYTWPVTVSPHGSGYGDPLPQHGTAPPAGIDQSRRTRS